VFFVIFGQETFRNVSTSQRYKNEEVLKENHLVMTGRAPEFMVSNNCFNTIVA